jgi:hypothetical protein
MVFFHCYLGNIRTMDKVRKPDISVCYFIVFVAARMFTESLPRNGLHSPVVVLLRACIA